MFYVILYCLIGSAITAALMVWYSKIDPYDVSIGLFVCVGLFWPIAAPFTTAVVFALSRNRRP